MSVKGQSDPYRGGSMKPDRSTKGIKSKPFFSTKRIPNPPKDQNKESYPR